MYSGLTLTRYSGCILGAHQKIDRVARRLLSQLEVPDGAFPPIRFILHFEGQNGPDAIKRKSPGHDEPRHFFNPFDEFDTGLTDIIEDHYAQLVRELRAGNTERAAFEASWIAHAIVDGLTPAHHFPYDEEVSKIRGNKTEAQTSIRKKWIVSGDNPRTTLANTWKIWGAKGLLMTHGSFEMGVATLLLPMRLKEAMPTKEDIEQFNVDGLIPFFRQTAVAVAKMNMFDRFVQQGWTGKLAGEVRHELAPRIVKLVVLVWYAAVLEAAQPARPKA